MKLRRSYKKKKDTKLERLSFIKMFPFHPAPAVQRDITECNLIYYFYEQIIF